MEIERFSNRAPFDPDKEKKRERDRNSARKYRLTHSPEDRREYFKKYDAERLESYRARRKELDAERYKKNREQNLARNKEYHRKKKEEIAKRKAAWRAMSYSSIRSREIAYAKSERGKLANNSSKRRRYAQKKYGSESTATPKEILALKHASKHCYYCRAIKPLTLDHFWPLAKGGTHTIGNLVFACKSCNSRKSKMTPDDWAARSGYDFGWPTSPTDKHPVP